MSKKDDGVCESDLPPAEWGVYPGAAPSVWQSKAHQSVRTTILSCCSEGLCIGLLVG